jgi:IS4 transposase
MAHADSDPVVYRYASNKNISMQGKGEVGFTWGEWREMSDEEQERELQDIVNELVEVCIVDDER